ncbi:MAG: NAD(P)-dependent oxidoreductase [Candidatus Abawacabacteria bacterium]|nr:NAD(P)-dependent oxidoreductase [Candidatus Abawacabacteria bacterium]
MSSSKKKILITGGRGFLGRNLQEGLGDTYHILAPGHTELDLLDEGQVRQFLTEHRFDVVIHCANHDDSRNSKKDPTIALKNNLYMFFNLIKHKSLYGRMFYFGSGRAYDQRFYIPQMPEEYLGEHLPIDDYGLSKYIMSKYIENIPNICELRIFGLFGKYEDWEIRFISYACCKVMFGQDIVIHQNRYMSYVWVHDLIKLLKFFIEKESLKYSSYNICSAERIDLLTITDKVQKIADKTVKVLRRVEELGKEYSGNNNRLKEEIGDFTFTNMDDSIKELYQWYEGNKASIDESLLLLNK